MGNRTTHRITRSEMLRVRVTPAERQLVRWLAEERGTSEGSVLRWALRQATTPSPIKSAAAVATPTNELAA